MQKYYGGGPDAEEKVRRELQANRYNEQTDTLEWTNGQTRAFQQLRDDYDEEFLNRKRSGAGLGPNAIPDPGDRRRITAFIAWTAWTAAARRPDCPYSYTNNWPPEPLVGNELSEEAVIWSVLSLIALLGGIGLVLAAYGRYSNLVGWHGMEERRLRFISPDQVSLTPAQRTTAWYFFVVAALFLLQTPGRRYGPLSCRRRQLLWLRPRAGVALQPLPHLAPATIALRHLGGISRRGHLPGAADRRPRAAGQGLLSCLLLVALAVVVVGSLMGEAFSFHGVLKGEARPMFGAQGWEYLDLGRFWQYLLIVGMLLWIVILFCGATRSFGRREPGQSSLPILLQRPLDPALLRGGACLPHAIPVCHWRLLAIPGLSTSGSRILELFTTIMVAYFGAARSCLAEDATASDLPRRHPLLGGGGCGGQCTTSTSVAVRPFTWRSAPARRR